MKKNKVLFFLLFYLFILKIHSNLITDIFYLPVDIPDRRVLKKSYITQKGEFGIWRKSYKNIMSHYHTGIDFKNPGKKAGQIEPVLSSGIGIVKSVIKNGPSSCVIIEHTLRNNKKIYSVYLHITDITVKINDTVNEKSIIGTFIDHTKLDKWGEYLNHLHFEMLKVPPKFIGFEKNDSLFYPYSIDVRSKSELVEKYYDPTIFFLKEE